MDTYMRLGKEMQQVGIRYIRGVAEQWLFAQATEHQRDVPACRKGSLHATQIDRAIPGRTEALLER
ncbi:MAG: hypothetical protein NVSMB27_23910 [Ktedonobacteraceae bacterium]